MRATFRPRKLEEANRAYVEFLAGGFATAAFEGQPEPETLQCRDNLDRTNWIGLLIKCQAFIGAVEAMGLPELADGPIDPPIRCTSNRMYSVSYRDALGRMFDLLDKVGRAQANNWRMKDLVAGAESNDELRAVDLTEGWP